MNLKSNTCFGQKTGKPLTEYNSESEARVGAAHVKSEYGRNLVPYQCRTCGFWHLSPVSRQTPSRKCYNCTDSRGNIKDLYQSKKAADRRAEILFEESGVRLKVYKCPYNDGWHLSKGKR